MCFFVTSANFSLHFSFFQQDCGSALSLCLHPGSLPSLSEAIYKQQCLKQLCAHCIPPENTTRACISRSCAGFLLICRHSSWQEVVPILMAIVARGAGRDSGSQCGSLPRTCCPHSPLSSGECLLSK